MQTIELFCGTKSFSKVANELGHSTFTIDNQEKFNPDICCNVLDLEFLPMHREIIWASPPCTAFSVASIGTHWTGGKGAYIPKSETAKLGLEILDHTIKLIAENKPKFWFVENPRGVMRKVIDKIFEKYDIIQYRRVSVCYCKYGDTRMKPTDIWTNLPNWEGKMCFNGCKDHISSPRGSKTGTQGLKGSVERSVIPEALFKEIFKEIEDKKFV